MKENKKTNKHQKKRKKRCSWEDYHIFSHMTAISDAIKGQSNSITYARGL